MSQLKCYLLRKPHGVMVRAPGLHAADPGSSLVVGVYFYGSTVCWL